MDIAGNTFVHCANFAAPYEGNFILSLKALEKRLISLGGKMVYVFPLSCKNQNWIDAFCADHTVYFVIDNDDVDEVGSLIKQLSPDLIHTHFEGFDVSVSKSVELQSKNIKVVWHLHDNFSFLPNPIKAIYQCICFWIHYNANAKNVSAIGVGEHLLQFVRHFKVFPKSEFVKEEVIPNGVNVERIRPRTRFGRHEKFTFLTYGGRNADKRVDVLLKAARRIVAQQYSIEILITRGVDTMEVANKVFSGKVPEWCKIIPQQNDISELLSKADCFVSSSVHEGHSYAICEASIFGIPIIQSDIPGNSWNSHSPSTFSFKSESVEDLQRAMIEVIQKDGDDLKNACLITQAQNMKKYSIEAWVDSVINFYCSL